MPYFRFCYRFWSDACRRVKSKRALVPVTGQAPVAADKPLLKLTAIERYVNLAVVAQIGGGVPVGTAKPLPRTAG